HLAVVRHLSQANLFPISSSNFISYCFIVDFIANQPTLINIHATHPYLALLYLPLLISLTKPSVHCDQVKTLPIQS
ncbi:MAG: hypothetical protein ACRDCQ_00710, partial [Aeromonas sobria]